MYSPLLLLGLVAGSGVPASQQYITSVQVVDDTLNPVRGAVVLLDNFGDVETVVTSTTGQSAFVDFDSTGLVQVVASDTVTAEGTALGFVQTIDPWIVVDPTADLIESHISRTMPTARPHFLEGFNSQPNTIHPPASSYDHWSLTTPPQSTLKMNLQVAPLLDRGAINGYLNYRGHSGRPDNVRGLAMVVPAVQLGTGGFDVLLNLLGDLPGDFVVDAYNFAQSSVVPIGPPLEVEVLGQDQGFAVMRVTGGLRRGHLALVARPAGSEPGQVIVQDDDPFLVGNPGNNGGGIQVVQRVISDGAGVVLEEAAVAMATAVVTSVFVQDCTPEAPQAPDGWECEPPTADPGYGCSSDEVVSNGPAQCQVVPVAGPLICKSPNTVYTDQRTVSRSWKVTFQFEAGTDESPLTGGGGFEYGGTTNSSISSAWTAGQGDYGLGECVQDYEMELVCAEEFTIPTGRWVPSEWGLGVIVCDSTRPQEEVCRDTYTSQSEPCSRIP